MPCRLEFSNHLCAEEIFVLLLDNKNLCFFEKPFVAVLEVSVFSYNLLCNDYRSPAHGTKALRQKYYYMII